MNSSRFSVVNSAAAVATALALGACGEDSKKDNSASTSGTTESEAGTSAPAGKSIQTIAINETEFKLIPSDPKVAKAGVVTFKVKNAGATVHALEVDGPKGEVETDEIQPGDAADLKVDLGKAGTFEMYCPVGDHRAQGMAGEITVAGGGSGSDGHGGY